MQDEINPTMSVGETDETAREDLRLSSYAAFNSQFEQLCKDWDQEIRRTMDQRMLRFIDIDVNSMRTAGKIKLDETILPIRVADMNIRREQPSYVAFFTQSRRSLIFRQKRSNLQQPVGTGSEQLIEEAFTQGMRYPGWELPLYGATDGAQTHGWDAVEIVYDETKPYNVSIEHIGHDKLLFPTNSIDIQFSEYLARGYDVTCQQLMDYVRDFDFDARQVKMLTQSDNGTGRRATRMYRIWKILFREDNVIKVAWRCDMPQNRGNSQTSPASSMADDWLKAPAMLYLGREELVDVEVPQPDLIQQVVDPITGEVTVVSMPQPPVVEQQLQPVSETEFPIYLLRYHQTEDQQIFSTRGRVFLDRYDQEAQTAIASGFVNKLMRSTNVFAAVGTDPTPGSNAAPKQLPVALEHGKVYDRPITFFSSDSPDPLILSALQYFGVRNANENGQTDFAVNNREDSRKTATEIQAATQQAGLLSGVQVTVYSTWICSLYKRCWEVVQSMAVNGKIPFPVETEIVAQQYFVRAAGDVDVTQRAEHLSRMQQMWQIISQTPAAQPFLRSFLTAAFPDEGVHWAKVIEDDQTCKLLLQQCAMMLKNIVMSRPEELKSLPPEQVQQLVMLEQQVAQVLGQPQQATA